MTLINVFSKIRQSDTTGFIQVQGTSPELGVSPVLCVYTARRDKDNILRMSLGPDYLDFLLAFGPSVDLLQDLHELASSYDPTLGWVN